MNIVMIPAFFATKNRPTLGNFFLEQAKALHKAGNQVTILYCDTYSVKMVNEYLHYQEEHFSVVEGVRIYRKPVFCLLKHGMEGHESQFSRGILELFDQYMGNEKIDVIHAHCCMWAGTAANKLEQKYGIPYVITEHATVYQLQGDSISSKNKEKIREAFEHAKKVICVSPKFAETLVPFMGNQKDVEIIGNIVDCKRFDRIKEKGGQDTFTFFTLCYMDTEAQLYKKGMDLLIQAFAKLERSYPEVNLRIGGGGTAISHVKRWVEDEKLRKVTFLGNLDREEVVSEMQGCQCFVLPSRYETFGVVYIEAMACGKPVIGVANGGPDTFITPKNGLLIHAKIEELEMAMQAMVEDVDRYDAEEIREYVQDHFSGEVIAEKLTELYQEVMVGNF